MQVSHWSRAFWTSMFATALGYPGSPKINDQFNYKRFYLDIQYILPCEKCRRHYRKHLKQLPINPFLRGGRKALFAWVLRIHNMVSADLGKPALTASQAMRKYFPDMTLAEARAMGQKIDPVMIKAQSGGDQSQSRSGAGYGIAGLGVGLGAAGLLYYFMMRR